MSGQQLKGHARYLLPNFPLFNIFKGTVSVFLLRLVFIQTSPPNSDYC